VSPLSLSLSLSPRRPATDVFQPGYHRQIYRDCARNYLLARDTPFVTHFFPTGGYGVLPRARARAAP